jgi:hypothetical protein
MNITQLQGKLTTLHVTTEKIWYCTRWISIYTEGPRHKWCGGNVPCILDLRTRSQHHAPAVSPTPQYPSLWGDRGSTVVKVLHYKSEGRWFDPRWCHGIFHLYKSFWSHHGPGVDPAQWLRYCATNQKVAGSIPDGVAEFFIYINPSDRTTALGSTQPLTEMSTRSISWGVNAAGA